MKITIFVALLLLSFSTAFSQNAKNDMINALGESNYELAETFIANALIENPKDVELFLLAGDVYLELEKNDLALATYKAAEKISSKPFVLRKLANGMSAAGLHTDAVKMLRKLTLDEKKEVANWLVLADVYIRADSISQAELAVTRAREMDDKNVRAYIVLGDLYFKQRVYELSKNNYEEALKLNPDLLEARMKLAQSYYWLATREVDDDLRNELFTRSLQEWNTLTQKDPKNSKAWFEQGKIFFFSKNYLQAAQSLNNYIQLRPNGSLGRWYLAQSLYELGRCDSARIHLKTVAAEIDTAANQANLLLARCYLQENDYAESAHIYSEITKTNQLQMEDVRRYGQASLFSGDTNTAVQKWKQAIEMDAPGNCQLMYILGTSLNKMKRYDEAVEVLQKRLNVGECADSLDYIIHYFIGISNFFNTKTLQAVEPLNKAISLNPEFLWSRIYLGDVYANMDSLQLAENQFNLAITKGTTDPVKFKNELNQAYFKLAGMKLDQKKFKDLEKVGKDWLTAMPESEYAALFTAFAYQGQNNVEMGCKYYRMCLKINPNNKTAKDNLKALGCE